MTARRRLLVGLALGTLSPAFLSYAQQPKVARIGILSARSRPTPSKPEFFLEFVKGMRELGYIEGKNLIIEWRYADAKQERLPALAAELVLLKPAVIVTHATPAKAVKAATSAIPVVVTSFISDPVRDGFAKSLSRPGGNFTGMSLVSEDVSEKNVELLRIMLPQVTRYAVLVDPELPYHAEMLKKTQAGAQVLGIQILPVPARDLQEIERGFETMVREHVKAVIVLASSLSALYLTQISELGLRHRVAVMGAARPQAVAGSLIVYGTDIGDTYRRAAGHVDKILKGARPGDLPIEQPRKFELIINRKTAAALGVTIPRELLLRADEVIE